MGSTEVATPRIGILIVAYNAASSLAGVLDRIPVDFRRRVAKIFVFDDHSQDSTYLVGLGYQQLASDLPLEIVRHQQNLGYGGNQKAGYQRAFDEGLDVIVLLHGDGQYAPELLAEMVAPLLDGQCDAVFGSRMMVKGAARKGGMPLYKYMGNKVLTRLENVALGTDLSEFHSGYRAYSVDALRRLDLMSFSNGFDFDTEIIIGLVDAGLSIVEIPIPTYYGDEICYVNGLRYALDVTTDVIKYRARRIGFGPPDTRGRHEDAYDLKQTLDSSHHAILEWLDRPACRVLDLGCSGGLVSQQLRRLGHYVVGVDIVAHPEVKERTDEFHVADLDFGLPAEVTGKFDVILCGDVLEHVRRPDRLLARLPSLMTAQASVVASVPNFGHWYPRLRTALGRFDYDQRGILDTDHVRFFTRRSFSALCSRAGWKVVRSRTTGVPLEFMSSSRMTAAASTIERMARWLWPTMFAYQFIYELRPEAA